MSRGAGRRRSGVAGAERRLGFDFTPLPRRARRARREGRLSPAEYDLLGLLYDRAHTDRLAAREETPRLTLAQIAEGVHWPHQLDSLSRLVRRLADKAEGWFRYRVEKGAGGYFYVFTLAPDGPPEGAGLSERRPSTRRRARPSADGGGARMETPFATAQAGGLSAHPSEPDTRGRPSRPSRCPTRERPANPHGEAERAAPPGALVRPAQNGEIENLGAEEPRVGASVSSAHDRLVRGEVARSADERLLAALGAAGERGDSGDGGGAVGELIVAARRAAERARAARLDEDGRVVFPDALDRGDAEAAIVRDLDALVAGGLAREEPNGCRWPSHRPSAWRSVGGRLVCGVCHPQVEVA